MYFLIEYKEYFRLSRNGRNVEITLGNDLPETILESQSYIILTIVASVEGNSDLKGSTVLIISLPEKNEQSTGGTLKQSICVNKDL